MSTKQTNSPTPPPTLTEQVLAATQSDLDSIDETIQFVIDKINEQQRAVDGLRAIRKAIAIRLNGKPQRQKREAGSAASSEPKVKLADLIFDLLTKEGSMPVPAIAERLSRTPAAIGMCVGKSNWFVRHGAEVHIAKS